MSFCHSEARRRRARNLLVAFGWRSDSALRLTGHINLNGGFSRRGSLPFGPYAPAPAASPPNAFANESRTSESERLAKRRHTSLPACEGASLAPPLPLMRAAYSSASSRIWTLQDASSDS